LVTFDFTTEPRVEQSNGLTELYLDGFPPRATFTGEFGREIKIVTFLLSGSSTGYFLDTFGSGPSVATTLWGQRGLFGYGDFSGPQTLFDFGSPVELVSATFVLYAQSPNLEISVRTAGATTSTKLQYFFSGGPDFFNPPDPLGVPPERMVTFDNTVPLTDRVTMFSLGVPGAALKTLVIDDPAVVAPVPEPSSLAVLSTLSVFGLGVAAWRKRKRKQR
jgi:hypothetical protein